MRFMWRESERKKRRNFYNRSLYVRPLFMAADLMSYSCFDTRRRPATATAAAQRHSHDSSSSGCSSQRQQLLLLFRFFGGRTALISLLSPSLSSSTSFESWDTKRQRILSLSLSHSATSAPVVRLLRPREKQQATHQ